MTRALRSRSASACRAIDRFIESGSTTSLISTRSMRMPQPRAGLSIINSRPWLSRSRLDSRSSRLLSPMVDRRADRVLHLEVDDGVDAHRDVVAGNAVLGGHRQGDDLQVHLLQAIDDRDQPCQSRPADPALDPAEAVDDAALELLDHPDVLQCYPQHTDPGG